MRPEVFILTRFTLSTYSVKNKAKKSRVEMTNFVWQSSIGTVDDIVIDIVKELRNPFCRLFMLFST